MNQQIIKNAFVLFPPFNEQQEIVNYLDRETALIDKTIDRIQHSIDLLIEYRQSLISHVVTEKVKVF